MVLYTAYDALRVVTLLAHPVLPHATQKIWEQLGNSTALASESLSPNLSAGQKRAAHVGKPEGVFPRVDKKEAFERIEAMEDEIRNPPSSVPAAGGAAQAGTAPAPSAGASAKIGIEDFAKIEMRVG